MKVYDLVNLPQQESSVVMWLRLSFIQALVFEHRALVIRQANDREKEHFQNEHEPRSKSEFEEISRSVTFEDLPKAGYSIDFEESYPKSQYQNDESLVFAHSITEVKRDLMVFCETESTPTVIQLGLPQRELELDVNFKIEDTGSQFIEIQFPDYQFSHDDFCAVNVQRETEFGCYGMSFLSDEDVVCYDFYETAKNRYQE